MEEEKKIGPSIVSSVALGRRYKLFSEECLSCLSAMGARSLGLLFW